MRHHHPLVHVGGICGLALTFFGCWWMNSARLLTEAQNGLAERVETKALAAVHGEADKTRTWLGGQIAETRGALLAEIARQGDGLRGDARGQVVELRKDVMARVDRTESDANQRTSEAISVVREFRTTADGRLASIQELLTPPLAASTRLMDTYSALPGQVGAQLAPSWAALQPEITCRWANGTGYGGCWHSRITGLMGEAVQVGGVFTQHFPSLANSIDGIGVSVNKIGVKITTPATRKQQVWDTFRSMAIIGARFM